MKRYLTLLWFVLLLPVMSLRAAEDGTTLKEKIEARRVSFLTQRLDLTPAESQVFWPVYSQYRKELDAVRKNKKEIVDANLQSMSDTEIAALLEAGFAAEAKELEIKQRYYSEFRKILSAKKIAKLYKAEKDFIKIVLDEFYNNPQR